MSFPPLHPAPQSSNSSSETSKAPSTGSLRPRQTAWGLSAQPSGRRGLTPLATNVPPPATEPASTARPSSSASPSTVTSPFASSFSSVLNSSARPFAANSRQPSSSAAPPSSTPSPFAAPQAGAFPPGAQLLASPRSRATTPFASAGLAATAGAAASSASTASGGGGGNTSGGGSARSATFSPSLPHNSLVSPVTATFDRSAFNLSSSNSNNSGQSSVSKIVVTQVFLLLGSITEKEGKAKWDAQAEQIRKLVESHGMEVFAKYFRRLLVGNAPQIFPNIHRNAENPGNYPLLVQEIEKASQDVNQAKKIAEIIDTSEGDIYRDFDLSTFINHFNLDAIPKSLLASAFTRVSRADLKTKAASILLNTFPLLLQAFANADGSHDIAPSSLGVAAFEVLRCLSDLSPEGTEKSQVYLALESRFSKQDLPIPPEIRSAMSLVELLEAHVELALEIQKQGPSATSDLETAKEFLRRCGSTTITPEQIAGALLYLVLVPEADQYHPHVLVAAVRALGDGAIHWPAVVSGFDRRGLTITPTQFLSLYHALLPIAQSDADFDIQLLWGGQWENTSSQFSFALAFASLSPEQLDATLIPGLRLSYEPMDVLDGQDDLIGIMEEARRDPMISRDAVTAISDILWSPINPVSHHDGMIAKQIIGEKMTFFLCSVAGVTKPWNPLHQTFMARMVVQCLAKVQPDHKFILHCLWRQDKQWLATRLMEIHIENPLQLPVLFEAAEEQDWLKDLCTLMNGLGIDLAALAHRAGKIDFDEWVGDKLQNGVDELVQSLVRFLRIKIDDEMRTVHGEQAAPRTIGLAMKTVYAMLTVLDQQMKDRQPEELISLERKCMQAFPRLINYGEGFDEVIESNGKDSNLLPPTSDAEMQDLYKRMYSAELEVRDIIEALQACKTSTEPAKQDLFACMIHGLFDEYVCYNEYPLGPLATTAVLFGGIIAYGLISKMTLSVGLEMVLEAVRDFSPESAMYKFGLQALIHFLDRLPEWPHLCRQLVQIPGLQGTDAYARAQQVVRNEMNGTGPSAITNGSTNGLATAGAANGDVDRFSDTELAPQFDSVHIDPIPSGANYEDPEEEVQDKVLFVLNNVSEQNLSAKIGDLVDTLQPKHHHWFANYLVEQRAKFQPNYQQLYLDLLSLLGEPTLWADVLRETYVSVRKVLNAESTMKSTSERAYLKNLGAWLGSLTVARDKPIKHKNISFKELLIEGWETERLLLVIPFTCEVLSQVSKSVLFKPPNPWTMEIIGLLLELYDLPELKIQQKFAVEVLLTSLGLPKKGEGMERSNELMKRQMMYEEDLAVGPPDVLESFEELTIGSLNKGLQPQAKFSVMELHATLPDLIQQLRFPPVSIGQSGQGKMRQIVIDSVRVAVEEIIGPVIERSMTIASIATQNLINKDFAQEPDEARLRLSFEQMAKSLSGSLALVTCKEPLRMSIMNNIRGQATSVPDQSYALPEGSILMCVNDNLDIVCNFVEKHAEKHCLNFIEPLVEIELANRRQFKAEFPHEHFRDPVASHWSTYIPEPYKQLPGGLNQQQLEIYTQFGRQARGTTHQPTVSTDSGKQIPDVLQLDASFPSMPNMSTPAEHPALPHPTQQIPPSRMLPPVVPPPRGPSQVNGYMDTATMQEHIQESLAELVRLAKQEPEKRFRDLAKESPVVELMYRIVSIVRASADAEGIAMPTAITICQGLYMDTSRFEVEVLVQLLSKVCEMSASTAMKVILLFRTQDEDHIMVIPVTVALLEARLLHFVYVDQILAKAIHQRKPGSIECLSGLLDALVFGKAPIGVRADFANSLGAMADWLAQDDSLDLPRAITMKLRSPGADRANGSLANATIRKQDQMQYIFNEWLSLYGQTEPPASLVIAFISQVHQAKLFATQEDIVLFLRMAIDGSADLELHADPEAAYLSIDALAQLIVLMVHNLDASQGSVAANKPAFLKCVLQLLVLILNNHHVVRGDHFSQRLFYRLFSNILHDWQDICRNESPFVQKEMILAFSDAFLLLDPRHFPGFTFACMGLIAHRVFLPSILKLPGTEGQLAYAKLIAMVISYVGELLTPSGTSTYAKELYKGLLRILLILHHDFAEFLADNHYSLCNAIPPHCVQLRNLVLHAFPPSIQELPDPLTAGLKVDRLDEIRKAPTLVSDFMTPLHQAHVTGALDNILRQSTMSDDSIASIAELIYATARRSASLPTPTNDDAALANSIVLYLAQSALVSGNPKAAVFNADASPAKFMSKLTKELNPEARYVFLNAVANQLRYPNSHTYYFSHALLHLFGSDHADQQESDVRQQITRILLERLLVQRPHPWGLVITYLELLKNPIYMFWELPFIKNVPGTGKLFTALFPHVTQSPRTLA